MLVTRGLERVLGDLTALGYDTKWTVMGASDVGANHQRDRIWIVAHSNNARIERWKQQPESSNSQRNMADTSSKGREANEHAGSTDRREICGSVSQQGENGGEQSLVNADSKGLEGPHNNCEIPKWIQQESGQRCAEIPNASSLGLSGQGQHEQSINSAQSRERETTELVYGRSPDFWAVEPNVGRVADGVAARVDRLKAIGNGQVPLCAATAWRLLNAA